MRSKTFCCNKTVLKKDITRYLPLWMGYTALLMIGLFGTVQSPAVMARDLLYSLYSMAVVNLIYAGLCAAFLFMDLYNGRLCNAIHAFPIRRETWLSTHVLSGFLFNLVPNLLASVLAALLLWDYAYFALIWLTICTLQFLFFYGTAVLCAVCAGNLIGMGTLYGIFHFITVLVAFAIEVLYLPLLHGIKLNEKFFYKFFPINQIANFDYVDYSVDYSVEHLQNREPIGKFEGFYSQQWLYTGLCTVVGILCLLLAVQVYRKRNLENAGELLSVKKLSPIYLVICTLGAGVFMYLLTEAFSTGSYIFMFAGIGLGYFAARMLLNRTVKVFTKKVFAGLGVFILVLGASFLLTWLDPIGITRYVPEADKIEYAAVVGADKNSYYMVSESYLGVKEEPVGFKITDPNEIADVQDFHRELIEYRVEGNERVLCSVRVIYQLRSGRTVQRYYQVAQNSSLAKRANVYASDIRYIFEVNDPQVLYTAFESVSISGGKDQYHNIKLTDTADIQGLIAAIEKDCAAGTMAQNWAYHEKNDDRYYLDISVDEEIQKQLGWSYYRTDLQVWSDGVHTTEYIRQMIDKYPEAEETEDYKYYPVPEG